MDRGALFTFYLDVGANGEFQTGERECSYFSRAHLSPERGVALYLLFFFFNLVFLFFGELLYIDCSLQCSRHWRGEGSSSRSLRHRHKPTWSQGRGYRRQILHLAVWEGFLEEVALERASENGEQMSIAMYERAWGRLLSQAEGSLSA